MFAFTAPIVLATVFATASPSVGAGGAVVVVVPLAGGADAAARDAITDELRKDATALGLNVQPKKTTAQHVVTAGALGIACDFAKPDCMVKIGALAGAALVIGGTVDAMAGGSSVALRVIDVGGAKTRAQSTLDVGPIGGDAKVRERNIRLLTVRLLAPERERGTIDVSVKQKGATVVVDGKPVGQSPLKAPVEVPPGKHEIYVAAAGFESRIDNVEVAFDDHAHIDVELTAGTGGPALPELKVAELDAPATSNPDVSKVDLVAADNAAKRNYKRIAVYPLEANGVEPRVSRVVTDAVLQELRKRQNVAVIGTDEIKAMLDFEANRQMLGCEANASCLAEIAGALGADIVVIGNVARVGNESVFGLRRLDQKTATVTAQETVRLTPADGEEFVAAVGDVVKKVFDLQAFPLRPGEKTGAPPELALRINPPPLPTWAFWTTAVSAGVVTVGAAAAGAANLVALDTYDQQLHPAAVNGVKPAADGAALKETEALIFGTAAGFWGGVAGGLVIGGAAGLEALFTDWNGYNDDDAGVVSSTSAPATTPAPTPATTPATTTTPAPAPATTPTPAPATTSAAPPAR